MMNTSIKSALSNPQSSFFRIKSAFFHSTTFLERGRRNAWTERYNYSNKNRRSGYRRNHFKQNLMRDANAYIEHLFESWQSDFDEDDQSPKKGPSWFRQPNNGSRRNASNTRGRQNRGRRGYSFCEEDDDDDVEAIFRSTFGGDRFFFWSFVNEDYPNSRNSSRYSNRFKTSWKWRHQKDDEYDEYEHEYTSKRDTKKSDLASERIALGLSASGPLKLEDVKNAYRACALKWHPDRHLGSSKADAEEKFKQCTAAYQSLCDRLAIS